MSRFRTKRDVLGYTVYRDDGTVLGYLIRYEPGGYWHALFGGDAGPGPGAVCDTRREALAWLTGEDRP